MMRLSQCTHLTLIISFILLLCSIVNLFLRPQTHINIIQSKQTIYIHNEYIQSIKNLSNNLQDHQVNHRRNILGTDLRSKSIFNRFEYVNPSKLVCNQLQSPENSLIIIVLSRALNLDYRQAIRATWGRNHFYSMYNITVHTVFFVGIDDSLESAIRIEQTLFNDVVEINIPEHQTFMTFKELAGLFWLRLYCPTVRYLFRIDDDLLLNIFLLLDYIQQQLDFKQKDGLHGWFRHRIPVYRTGRWPVTKYEYIPNTYPSYSFTIGFLFSNTSCQRLIQAANKDNHQIIRINDAYITGILRESANISYYFYTNLDFASTFQQQITCNTLFLKLPRLLVCTSKLHIGIRQSPTEYYDIWNIILNKSSTIS